MRLSIIAIATLVALAAIPAAAQDIRGALPYRMYRDGTAKSLEKSNSPRDWALASQLLETDAAIPLLSHERAALLLKAAQAAPNDHLVQWMWANAALSASDCGAPAVCGARAGAIARLEPDNAAAWLPVVDRAWKAKDATAVDGALAHMAAAKRYDAHYGMAAAAWIDVYKRFPPPSLAALKNLEPSGQPVTQSSLVSIEAADTVNAPDSALIESCRKSTNANAPAPHFATCGHVARLMLGQASTLYGRIIGFNVLRGSGEEKPADVPGIRETAWLAEQFEKALSGSDETAERETLADTIATGSEVTAVQNLLRHTGTALAPPPKWQWIRNGQPVDMLHAPATH
jgi:hypothetical protein